MEISFSFVLSHNVSVTAQIQQGVAGGRLTVLSIVDRPMSSFSFSLFFLSAIFSKSFERKANAFILHGVKLVTVNI